MNANNNNINSNCLYKASTTESNVNTYNTSDQLNLPLSKQLPTTSSIDNKSLLITNKSTYDPDQQLHSHPQDANAVVDGLINMSSMNSSINAHSKRQLLKQNNGLYRETISDKKSISIGNDGETNKSNASSITKKSFPSNKSKDKKPITINKQDNEEYNYALKSSNKVYNEHHHHNMHMPISKTLGNNKKEHSLFTQHDINNDTEHCYITQSDKHGCSNDNNNEHMLNGYVDILSLMEIKRKKDMIDMQMEEEHRMELLSLQQAQTKSFVEDENRSTNNTKRRHELLLDDVDYNFPLEEIDSSEFNENINFNEGSDNDSPEHDDNSKSTRNCIHKPQTPQQQQHPSINQSQRSCSKYSSLNLNVSLSQKAPSISSSTNTANKDIPHANTTQSNTNNNHCTSSLNNNNTVSSLTAQLFSQTQRRPT